MEVKATQLTWNNPVISSRQQTLEMGLRAGLGKAEGELISHDKRKLWKVLLPHFENVTDSCKIHQGLTHFQEDNNTQKRVSEMKGRRRKQITPPTLTNLLDNSERKEIQQTG